MSICLAGRFPVVLGAGSWSDLHVHAWGGVRLFCLDAPRKQISIFKVAMLTFDQYESLLFSQVGNPFVRRGLAYPFLKLVPLSQSRSIAARGTRLTRTDRKHSSSRSHPQIGFGRLFSAKDVFSSHVLNPTILTSWYSYV